MSVGHVCQFQFEVNDLYAYAHVLLPGGRDGRAAFQFINTAGWSLLLKDWELPAGVKWKDGNGNLMLKASAMDKKCTVGQND